MLRHGGMERIFTGLRAPTTLGTHLRGYQFGHVRQLDAVASRLLARLATVSPILAGAEQMVFLDVDDTIRETHGYQKQGAAYGYSKVKGLNAQVAILSTPLAAPVIAATRLRKGNINSGHGAARLIADSLATLRRATTPGMVIVRADSAYYRHDVITAARAGGAKFSVTARLNPDPPTVILLVSRVVSDAVFGCGRGGSAGLSGFSTGSSGWACWGWVVRVSRFGVGWSRRRAGFPRRPPRASGWVGGARAGGRWPRSGPGR